MKLTSYLKRAFLICLCVGSAAYISAQTPVWSVEAENFDENLPANPNDPNNFPKATYQEEGDDCHTSGCAFLENISANSAVVYKNIDIATEGTYELWMYYMLKDEAGRGIGVTPNFQYRDTTGLWVMEQTGSWDGAPQLNTENPDAPEPIPGTGGAKIVKKLIYLEQGMNMLKIGGSGNGYTPNFDKFEIYTTTETIEKPKNVSCSWHWDYTDEAISVTLNGSENEDVKKVYDNNDETYLEVAGNSYIDFTFETDMRFTGFLIFTERANPIDPDDFEIQGRESESSSWVNASKSATDARGQGKVYQSNLGDGMYKYFRLQLKKEESETVRLTEIQFFGFPDVNIEDQPDYPITYPEDLILVRIDDYRTETETAVGLNGTYHFPLNGLVNPTNKWFECASRAVDGKRNTKYTLTGTKTFLLQYVFDEPVIVKSYSLAMCAPNNMDRNPAKWVLSASEDWGDTWFPIASQVEVENGKFIYPRCNYNNIKFAIPEEYHQEFTGFKIEIENNGGSDSHLSEFQLLPDAITSAPVSVKEVPALEGVEVYAKDGHIFINSSATEKLNYNVYNLLGVAVKAGTLTSACEVELQKGVYIVKVTSANGTGKTVKLINN